MSKDEYDYYSERTKEAFQALKNTAGKVYNFTKGIAANIPKEHVVTAINKVGKPAVECAADIAESKRPGTKKYVLCCGTSILCSTKAFVENFWPTKEAASVKQKVRGC